MLLKFYCDWVDSFGFVFWGMFTSIQLIDICAIGPSIIKSFWIQYVFALLIGKLEQKHYLVKGFPMVQKQNKGLTIWEGLNTITNK